MSAEATIQELLERGLYHYGLGEIKKALDFWREVLRREPGNETAREYLEIELGRSVEAPAPARASESLPEAEVIAEESERAAPALRPEFMEGQNYLHRGEAALAISAFETAHRQDSGNPIYWAHVELARAKLIKEVIDQMGGLANVPVLKVPLTDLIGQKSFSQEEGFVLSLLSGETSLEDLVALCPLPRFLTYRTLYLLLKDGLLEVKKGNLR